MVFTIVFKSGTVIEPVMALDQGLMVRLTEVWNWTVIDKINEKYTIILKIYNIVILWC